MLSAAVALLAAHAALDPFVRSDDWSVTGPDCVLFAAADVDGDGFGDLLTLNGSQQLCAAYSVRGWKSAPWEVLREAVPAGATGLLAGELVAGWAGPEVAVVLPARTVLYGEWRDGRFQQEREADAAERAAVERLGQRRVPGEARVEPPPYEPEAREIARTFADVDGDGKLDAISILAATKPYAHHLARLAVQQHDGPDADGDGVPDAKEAELGSDPLDRDTDDDGLPDGWEVNGLPRRIAGGDGALSPTRQDVIVAVSRYEQLEEAVARREVEHAKQLYAALPNRNPDGSTGVTLHLRWDPPVPKEAQGSWSWWEVGSRVFPARERGILHWMQITPGGGGQAQQTGDMGGSGAHWAAWGHELGHQLSLSHEGDSGPAWCPLYPSLMNYAFNYQLGGDPNAIRFSDGRFRAVELREDALAERLPFPYAEVRYLEAAPFRFTLEADGPNSTRIDWNQDGHFDDGVVAADINYGGSTYCGIRRNVEVCSAAPALFVLGGVAHLVTVDPKCSAVSVRACEGDGQWAAPRAIPSSPTRDDPVAVGVGDEAFVFFRTARSWCAARITKDAIDPPIELPELSTKGISVAAFDGRVLLVERGDDDVLAARWFRWSPPEGQGHLTLPQALVSHSRVPPGLAQEPGTRQVVMATSDRNPAGHDWCLRATWLAIDGETVREGDSLWTRGSGNVNHCTTRPVVAFRGPELNIFHTGWFDGNGLTTAWRTRRVGNQKLDDGWLTCLLYDVWTLTRVGVAFADGPQGAIYAYRWDPGDHGDMKVNMVQTAHNGWGIDSGPMRDFDDVSKITKWGIRHSILCLRRVD